MNTNGLKRLSTFFTLLCTLVTTIAAQQSTDSSYRITRGNDFWVMFLYNGGDHTPNQTSLSAVGDSNAIITVTNPATSWSTMTNLTANQSTQITVPVASSTSSQSNTLQTKHLALHITSTSSISLYANNYREMCGDISLVYPSHTLGTHYIMQDYMGDAAHTSVSGAEVGFVATLDNTILTMVLPCNLLNNSAHTGDTLTINLMSGESCQLIASAPGSFSGMEVTSNGKPFAAFQGNRVAYVPTGASGADLLYEQTVPVDYWGNDYVVVSTYSRNADRVRITSSENNCQVYANDTLICTLQKGETHEDILSGVGAKHYTSTEKICIGRYLCSNSSGGYPGDPSSVMIPPADQGLQRISFSAFSASDYTVRYINIVARNSYVTDITLDGNNISSQFTLIDTTYSIAQIPVSPAVHLLESPLGPIVADLYGLGNYASYACNLGRSFIEQQSVEQFPCPNRSSKGNDFWLMFPYNHNYNSGSHPEMQKVYLLGDQATTINISNNTSPTITTTLNAPNYASMQICGTNQQLVATIYNGGYHITSDNDIWVYADDYIDHNLDIALILPTEALGTHYIVQDYPSNNEQGAEVGFVATQDSTILTMTVPCNILGTAITAGTVLTVNLNCGQSYLLMAQANGSFSGMDVTSNGKPFALFVAGQNTAVPINGSGRDYTFEQALPIDLWGSEFIVSGVPEQSVNRLRITASTNNCLIFNNGTLLTGPLAAGQTWESSFPPSSQWHLTASSPIQVILYLGSYQTSGNNGDPSSVTIPPLNRGICDVRFTSTSAYEIPNNKHYVNIICHQIYDSGLTLDGDPLPSNESVITLGDYRCHHVPIPLTSVNQGRHHLQNFEGAFIAYTYGLGPWESYAYPLGIALDTVSITLQPIVHDTTMYFDTICQNTYYNNYGFSIGNVSMAGTYTYWRSDTIGSHIHHYNLRLTVHPVYNTTVNLEITIGDTLFYNGDTLTVAGTYHYSATAANGCDSTTTILLTYTPDTIEYLDTICQGIIYTWHGFSINTSHYTGTQEYWQTETVGDTIRLHHLLLTVLPTFNTSLEVLIILGDTLFYNGDTLVTAGTYSYTFSATNGCDSTVTLILTYEEVTLTASAEGLCPGDSATLTANGTHYAWWSASPPDTCLDSQQGMTTISISPSQTTIYSLCAHAGGPVLASVTVSVEAPPELCVSLSRPFIDYDFPVVIFTDCSEGSNHSIWRFSDGIVIEQASARRQFHYPLPDSVLVILQSCSRYNCCSDTSFYIPSLSRSVWFPNVFTPGEETNNRFGCIASFEITEFELHIYNRQGLLIYRTDDPTALWDGTRNGQPCPQGAYVYHWHVRDAVDYYKSGTGTVTLLR